MAINPAIAMGVRGIELQDPLAQYGRVAAIQGAQQQNALAQLQMQQVQREQEATNALNRAMAEAYNPQTGEVDINRLRGSLATGGYGSRLPDIEKKLGEVKTQRLTQQKTQGEIAGQALTQSKIQGEILDAALKRSRGFLENLDPDAPGAAEAYIAWHEANHRDPIIGKALEARGITAEQSRGRIMQLLNTPGGLARLINESKLGTEEFMKQNKPTTLVIDQSGQRQVIQHPGLGGALTTVGTYADVPLPPAVEDQKSRIGAASANRQTMNVNTQLPASEEAQKEFMKESRQTFSALKQAPVVLENIEAAKKLVPQAKGFMGAGGQSLAQAASFLNNRIGTKIDTQGVQAVEELRSRLFLGILDNLKKLDSQPSQQQQEALQIALGNIGTDPEALPRVLDVFGDAIRRKVNLYNEEVKDAENRGVKFPYNPQIKLPSQKVPPESQIPGQPPAKTVVRTGTLNGRRVVQYSDGSTSYAD